MTEDVWEKVATFGCLLMCVGLLVVLGILVVLGEGIWF